MFKVIIVPNGDQRCKPIVKPSMKNLVYVKRMKNQLEAQGHEVTVYFRGGRRHGQVAA